MSKIVRFSQVEEFLGELQLDIDFIDRKIVRVTNRLTPSRSSPFVNNVEVVATAVMLPRGTMRNQSPWVVKLEQYVGQAWQDGAPSDTRKTEESAEKIQAEIRNWATHNGRQIEIRAGTYE